MPRFFFTAQDKYHSLIKGDLDAPDKQGALEILSKRGLSPLQLTEAASGTGVGERISSEFSLFGNKLGIFDQITFIRHLGTLLNSGTDLLAALDTIAEDTIKPIVRKMVNDIKNKVTRGEMLSEAFRGWQKNFNPIFISLLKAGEASGNLPNILLSYAQELRKDYTFSRKLKGALIYPIVLLAALSGMIVIVLTFVVPRIKELFRSTKLAAPIYTQIMFWISDIWLAFMPFIIGFVVVIIFALIIAIRSTALRRRLGILVWYLPVLNKIQKNLVLMRFTKTTASLVDAGFSLKSALEITGDVVIPNYRDALLEIANKKLDRGISLSQALKDYPKLFPGTLVSVVATGEKSGQLSKVLAQMSDFYEEEVTYSLETFLTLIEPALLIVVGLMVGIMASSLISPLYNLIGSIK